jgi:hypothetical protein
MQQLVRRTLEITKTYEVSIPDGYYILGDDDVIKEGDKLVSFSGLSRRNYYLYFLGIKVKANKSVYNDGVWIRRKERELVVMKGEERRILRENQRDLETVAVYRNSYAEYPMHHLSFQEIRELYNCMCKIELSIKEFKRGQ